MKTYLTLEDIEALEEAASCQRDRLLIRFLFRLGCRVSEALGVGPEDIDFDGGTIAIQHLKSHLLLKCPDCGARLSRCHTYCPACGNRVKEAITEEGSRRRRRTPTIDDETLQQLRKYIDDGGVMVKNGRRLLFGINRHRAWQIVKECAEKAGLSRLVNPETGKTHHVSPHRLRDAFAVNAVKHDDSGDGLRMLQEHLGHASFNTTMRYRKVAGEEHREWYDRIWQDRGKPDGTQT